VTEDAITASLSNVGNFFFTYFVGVDEAGHESAARHSSTRSAAQRR
jgi:hypothetical protein